MIAREAGGGGVPCLSRREPRTPHLHRVPRQGIRGRARARPGRTRGKPSSPAGRERLEHPRAGPEAPSPTCHFEASRCRGCGRRRLREPRCVYARARACMCLCVCVCVRACESLFAARLLSRSRAATTLPAAAAAEPLRRRPALPPRLRPQPACASPPRSPRQSAARGAARRSRRAGPRAVPGPPPLLPVATLPPEPKPSPRSPNLPRLRSMPSAAPGGAGGGPGPSGPAGERRGERVGCPGVAAALPVQGPGTRSQGLS